MTSAGRHAAAGLLADDVVLGIVGIGQSWMQGGNQDQTDTAATPSPEHPGFALELNTGRRPHPVEDARFVDLYERIAHCERPLSGCADAVERALASTTGRPRPLVIVTSARGGSTLKGGVIPNDGLMPGSYVYGWMIAQLDQAARLVRAQGKRLIVVSLMAAHGEADAGRGVTGEEFAQGWRELRRHAQEDIEKATGQDHPVLLHMYQTSFCANPAARARAGEEVELLADVAWRQLTMSDADPLCRCIGPVYWATKAPDDRGHVTSRSQRRIGLQFGRYLFDDVFGAGRTPLRVRSLTWVDERILRVDYGRPVVVEEDDALVNVSALGPGKGYEIARADGLTVTGVAPAPDVPGAIDLTVDRPPPGMSGILLAGYRPTGIGVGRDHGGRTAVRSAAALEHDPQDGFVLHDWACVERLDLPGR